jgi:hypothetical protein
MSSLRSCDSAGFSRIYSLSLDSFTRDRRLESRACASFVACRLTCPGYTIKTTSLQLYTLFSSPHHITEKVNVETVYGGSSKEKCRFMDKANVETINVWLIDDQTTQSRKKL